jgi:nitric oxide reductase subunit C
MLSKKQARFFFFGGTIVVFIIFLGMTWDSIAKRIPNQTKAQNITQQVVDGKILWDKNNCMGCHTIFGEGAYYAPELTKVIERRGEGYVKALLMSPVPWAPNGRKMVAYGFSDEEAAKLVAYFKWIGEVDLNGFPPKPDINQ